MRHLIPPVGEGKEVYCIWEDAFTTEQLNTLQSMAMNAQETGRIGNNGHSPEIRRSKVKWVDDSENQFSWVFDILKHVVANINARFYRFDLSGFGEPMQLTNYSEEDQGTYNWHQDMSCSKNAVGTNRKLSIVIQLSDPSVYEGGNLEIMHGSKPVAVEKKRGLIAIFPSWQLHRVTPVVKGSRQSLVVWVSGPEFK